MKIKIITAAILFSNVFTLQGALAAPDPGVAPLPLLAAKGFHVSEDVPERGMHLNFDSLDHERSLNVTVWPDRGLAESSFFFKPYSNYHSWIVRAEVRIFMLGGETERPLEVLSVPIHADIDTVSWQPDLPGEYSYALRVYDADGHYDETERLRFSVSPRGHKVSPKTGGAKKLLAGYGESRLLQHHIALSGGKLRFYGRLPDGAEAIALNGIDIPVNDAGDYAMHEIVPAGKQQVQIEIRYADGHIEKLQRDITIPSSVWFAVGLADITVGRQAVTGPMAALTADTQHFSGKRYGDGRLTGYARGLFSNGVKVTTSVDTREQPLNRIFKGLNARDPRALLSHLKQKPAYSTYGDDSHIVEDAPTQGKFYVRVEKDKNKLLWGDFKTSLLDTEMAQVDRTMFGAQLHLEGNSQTSFGESKSVGDLFGAQPNTINTRESFRGTGGSIYFLGHSGVTQGSIQARIEVRARNSGQVLYAKELLPGVDYDVDALQGRVLLHRPLPFTPDATLMPGLPIQLNNRPDEVFLVTRYEYMPTLIGFSDREVGGRASQWLGDHIQVGMTADSLRTASGGGNYNLRATDILLRYKPATFLKAELAESQGQRSAETLSLNGGFNAAALTQGVGQGKARGRRVELGSHLRDFFDEAPDIRLFSYFQNREAGFSAPGKQTLNAVNDWETRMELPLSDDERSYLKGKFGVWDEKNVQRRQWGRLEAATDLNQHWFTSADLYGEKLRQTGALVAASGQAGSQLDLTGKLGYRDSEDSNIYALARSSLYQTNQKLRNDAAGGGLELRINERLKVSGEALAGRLGQEVHIASDYQLNDSSNIYLAYANQPTTTGFGQGGRNSSLTSGLRSRFAGHHSVYAEERWSLGSQAGLTQVYGLDLAPSDAYSVGIGFEHGRLSGLNGATIFHTAVNLNQRYQGQGWNCGLALEGRRDVTAIDRRKTAVARFNTMFQLDDAWRLLGKMDVSRSIGGQGALFAGNFTDASVAFAYRPLEDNRWNALMAYNYFDNTPAASQLTAVATAFDFHQRSHVLTVDGDYKVINGWKVGAKVAIRSGALQYGRNGNGAWFHSVTQLLVARTEVHVVERWDALLEWRTLRVLQAKDTKRGGVVGLYRHIGGAVKLGGGYNFTTFSDNLTDFSSSSRGWFMNVIGKF